MRKINGGILFAGFTILLTSGAWYHLSSRSANSLFRAGQTILIVDGDPAPPFPPPKPPDFARNTIGSPAMTDGDPAPPFPPPPKPPSRQA